LGASKGATLFAETGRNADEMVDARMESGSANATDVTCYSTSGQNNQVRLTCDSNNPARAVRDLGGGNIFDVSTVGSAIVGKIATNSQYRYVSSAEGVNHAQFYSLSVIGESGKFTSSPPQQAGMQEGLRLRDSGTGSDEGAYIRYDTGDQTDQARAGIVSSSMGSDYVIYTNSTAGTSPATEKVRIKSTGGISIGGGAPLTTSSQSGTGAICMAVDCAMETPSISNPIIGGGSVIRKMLIGSGILHFGILSGGQCTDQSLSMIGADTTGVSTASPQNNLGGLALSWQARVSAAGIVTVRVCNVGRQIIEPNVVSWTVSVIQ